MREMEEEKENLESTLGWGGNELPSDIHNMLGCVVCQVGADGTWKYCLDSLFYPLHPSHLCPRLRVATVSSNQIQFIYRLIA